MPRPQLAVLAPTLALGLSCLAGAVKSAPKNIVVFSGHTNRSPAKTSEQRMERRVSLALSHTTLREAVQQLVRQAPDLSVVFVDPDRQLASQRIPLVNVVVEPIETALVIVCEKVGAHLTRADGVYYIRHRDLPQGAITAQPVLEKIALKHQKALTLLDLLTRPDRLPEGIDAILNYPLDNSLLVSGTPEALDKLKRAAVRLDRPSVFVRVRFALTTVPTVRLQGLNDLEDLASEDGGSLQYAVVANQTADQVVAGKELDRATLTSLTVRQVGISVARFEDKPSQRVGVVPAIGPKGLLFVAPTLYAQGNPTQEFTQGFPGSAAPARMSSNHTGDFLQLTPEQSLLISYPTGDPDTRLVVIVRLDPLAEKDAR